jgi:hypothetical protein
MVDRVPDPAFVGARTFIPMTNADEDALRAAHRAGDLQSEPDEFGRKPPNPRRDLRKDAIGEPLRLRGSFRPIVGTAAHWHR